MRILLFGPPGVGKGTQATLLSKALSVPHVSIGDLFRGQIGGRTPLGLEAQAAVAAGDLIPDHVTQIMLADRLREPDCRNGFILDGFPRTRPQAEWLDELLDGVSGLNAVIELTAPEETLMKRSLRRGRTDDTAEALAHRLAIYHSSTEPLLHHYRSVAVTVDTDRAVDASHDDVMNRIRIRTPDTGHPAQETPTGSETIARLRRRAGLLVMGKANRARL